MAVPPRRKRIYLLGAVLVVLLVGGGLLWRFVLRDDPPPELALDPATGDTEPVPDDVSFDGEWTVVADGETEAGFRIVESFVGGIDDHTAVGRSPEVAGSLTIDGTEVTAGAFTVDLNALEFVDDQLPFPVTNRTVAMRTMGLEIDAYPTASFTLTEPIELGEIPAFGVTIEADAVGELDLHGVTRRLLGRSRSDAGARADELLDRFDLVDAGSDLVRTYSGGMRRRLDLAASLVVDPADDEAAVAS